MRYVIIATLILFNSILNGQSALDEKVNETFVNDDLEFILKTLDRKYKISIRYNTTLLPISNYDFDFQDVAMSDVLNIILKDNDLEYIEYAPQKIIIVPSEALNQESRNFNNIRNATTAIEQEEIMTLGRQISESGPFLLKGRITDNTDASPLENALILDKTTGDFTYSDANGIFELVMAPGYHEINISSVSHENYNEVINLVGPHDWIIELPYKKYYLQDVTINAFSNHYKVHESVTGLEQLNTSHIKKLNSFMGENDVIKSLSTLAGVSNIGEGSSGYHVRGGNIDQNLILQDGSIILNPSHILGFFSIFNSDIISTTSLYKGHIPAHYGGRVSSVLDIKLREADMTEFGLEGSLGLISSKVTADIPIIKQRSSLLISGRASYINWWLRGIKNIDIQRSDATFNDTNIKYTHKFSQKTKLIGSYFRSFDELQFSTEFGYAWRNEVASIQLKHIVNDHTSITSKMIAGSLSNNQFVPEGPLAFDLSSGMNYYQLGLSVLSVLNKHNITLGAEQLIQRIHDEYLQPINQSQSVSQRVGKERGNETSFFINDQWDVTNKIGINVGIRFNIYTQRGPALVNTYLNDNFFSPETIDQSTVIDDNRAIVSYANIEPRLSLRYNISNNASIHMSYNRSVQNIQLLSNGVTPTPIDIWQVSNTHILPLTSDNFALDLHYNVYDQLQVSTGAFYKSLDNTIEYKDFAQLTLNPNLETAILIGQGRAYGAELSVVKSGKTFSGSINYSYSRSLRRTNKTDIESINNGNWFSSNFDTPHEVKAFFNWQISKRDRFNINFILKTGRPITAPQSNFIVQGVVISDFSDRNSVRLPQYHRLDVSYTLRLNRYSHQRYKSHMTISFYNLYGRKNPFSVFFRQGIGSSIDALQLSVIGTIIPSITYDFSF